ncbi:hypothetical protein ACQVRX_04450 [Ralstonia pseudosolanacearum]
MRSCAADTASGAPTALGLTAVAATLAASFAAEGVRAIRWSSHGACAMPM